MYRITIYKRILLHITGTYTFSLMSAFLIPSLGIYRTNAITYQCNKTKQFLIQFQDVMKYTP